MSDMVPMPMLKELAEDFMKDACKIFLFTRGPMDPDTGEYTEVEDTLYNGKCMFYGPRNSYEGDDWYTFCVPLSVEPPPIKAIIRLTKCTFDKKKVGEEFEVVDTTLDSYDVYRPIVTAIRREPGT